MDCSTEMGIPETVVALIKSFHEGMKAWIHIHGKHLEEIEIENGLCQGCCLTPTLFNLYM